MNRSRYAFAISFLFAAFFFSSVTAQIPRLISYQGFIANAAGDPIHGSYNLGIKLYTDAGVLLHTENFLDVAVTKGVFTVILGSAGFPQSLDFSGKYFLGISINGGAELIPRTQLTAAPYALRANIADAIAPGANLVTSVNGRAGAIRLTGTGATTVTQSNDTIFIGSSGGGSGSGIQGVQNSDGAIAIVNPNGPVATINLQTVPLNRLSASGASFDQILKYNGSVWIPSSYSVITSARLAGGGSALSPLDIAQQGATNGQVLKWNSTTSAWEPGSDNVATGGGLTLPFSSTVTNANTLFGVTNNGAGRAGHFAINNIVTTSHVLSAETNTSIAGTAALYAKLSGTSGVGALLESTNQNFSGTLVSIATSGTGKGILVSTPDVNNTATVVEASTNGTGKAAHFRILNSNSSANAMEVSSVGSGHSIFGLSGHPNASGIYGQHGGTGIGVSGISQDGSGVYGYSLSNIGVRGIHQAILGTSPGVEGKTNATSAGTTAFNGASGVYGEVTPTNAGAWSAGVRGYNKSNGAAGIGVTGIHDGSGSGVYGETAGAGVGVSGKSTANGFGGYFDIPNGGGGWGVYASTAAKPGGGAWAVFSDRTMKQGVRPFADGLSVIEQIEPVWYRYNGKGGLPTDEEYVGIIAQEMEPIMPYALRQTRGIDQSSEKYLSFDPSALTYIQVNAIKELAAKLETMQQRILQLEQLLQDRGIDVESPAVTR